MIPSLLRLYLPPTVRTEIIEGGARTSRISSFIVGWGENTEKYPQPSAEITDLTWRVNSNVLARFSIISVLTGVLSTYLTQPKVPFPNRVLP